jgi:hypothetical protein
MSKKRVAKKTAGKELSAKTGVSKSATPMKATDTGPTVDPTPPDDSQAFVVFAFRLTRAERDLIHNAAGSAKASRLVKGAALAAATKDVDAFRALIAEVENASK